MRIITYPAAFHISEFCENAWFQDKRPLPFMLNRIDGVMVSMLSSIAIDRGLVPRSGQTKDYKIGICCFSTKHAALEQMGDFQKNEDFV